jgi:DNA topoisomerase-3
MRVFLAEKPSVAKDLARALGCKKGEAGYYIGERDIVTYAIGHLVALANPEVMNPEWMGSWFANKHKLPMLPTKWSYVDASPAPRDKHSETQFSIVKRLFNQDNVTEIVNAADAGREGEAIFRRIYQLSGSTKPVKRFWASSLTEEAIATALDTLKPASEFDGLWEAARTRAIIDWLWGMNYTRAYTVTNGSKYTIGRVQTPTLALIVRRQRQIDGFVKSNFYQVLCQLPGFVATAVNSEGKFDFEKKAQADAIANACPPSTVATVTATDTRP